MYRMSMLMDKAGASNMPKEMRQGLQKKISSKIEERQYQEEMRRAHEREFLEDFAKAYGYDVNKH